jgi:hypothetical protein
VINKKTNQKCYLIFCLIETCVLFINQTHLYTGLLWVIVPSQLALKTHTNFGFAGSLATLEKLVDIFPLPPVAPSIGDTSLTHVMRLPAHSTTSPTPTAMGQSFT